MNKREVTLEEYVEYSGDDIGILFLKSMLKLSAFSFLAIQLSLIHPFAAIAVLFFIYFTLPSSYTTMEFYKAIEAWCKPIFGLIISLGISYIFLSATGKSILAILLVLLSILIPAVIVIVYAKSLYSKFKDIHLYIILFFISFIFLILIPTEFSIITISLITFAFFVVIPEREQIQINNQNVFVLQIFSNNKVSQIAQFLTDKKNIQNLIFNGLMIASLPPIIHMSIGTGGISVFSVIIFVFWLFSLLVGLAAGPTGRPYVGILIIGLVTLLFSYQFTGVIGTAIFGNWWPTIEHGISIIVTPFSGVWESIDQQMKCLNILISNPVLYSTTPGCGAPAPPPSISKGSTRAIEITEFQAINYATGEQNINPEIPLIGSAIIENLGEFVANNIVINFGEIQIKDPSKVSAAHPEQGYYSLSDYWGENKCIFDSCTGAINKNDQRCEWLEKEGIFPGYKALITFKCGAPPDYKKWDYKVNCWDENGKKIDCPGKYKTYAGAGWFVSIPINYEFSYNANASLPVEIMNSSLFQKKLLAKEITLEEKQTTYTGGPVEIGIWTQKQPIRSREINYGKLSIKNNGQGIIKNLIANLSFSLSKEFDIDNLAIISGPCNKEKNTIIMNIENIKSYDNEICTFSYIPIIPDNIEKKSTIYITTVNYNYTTTYKVELQISNAPIQ